MPFDRQSLILNEHDVSEPPLSHSPVETVYKRSPQNIETVTNIHANNWPLAAESRAGDNKLKTSTAHKEDYNYNNVDLVARMCHEATASLFRSEFQFDHINDILSTDEMLSPEVLCATNTLNKANNYPHLLNTSNPKLVCQSIRCIQWRTTCPWPGCLQTFARLTDVDRHIDSVHYGIRHHCTWIEPNGLPCRDNNGNGYCRLEKLNAHQRQKHGIVWNRYS
ncbi:hypothetical protein B0O99DRAFT_337396 [Bisporella sp. PMI_857]|nr:hypothetical protein B0O99DRAFT_337396 [Bisporella sp. PMI_857]